MNRSIGYFWETFKTILVRFQSFIFSIIVFFPQGVRGNPMMLEISIQISVVFSFNRYSYIILDETILGVHASRQVLQNHLSIVLRNQFYLWFDKNILRA